VAKNDYRNRESRELFRKILPKWVKAQPKATAGELWFRALEQGHPLPTRGTWDRWVAKARKKAGIIKPKRQTKRRKGTVPITVDSQLVTERDVWSFMATDVPMIHVVILARYIRQFNIHLVRRKAKIDTKDDKPMAPVDYVDSLTHLSRLARHRITEAAMHLVRVRGWAPDQLREAVLD